MAQWIVLTMRRLAGVNARLVFGLTILGITRWTAFAQNTQPKSPSPTF